MRREFITKALRERLFRKRLVNVSSKAKKARLISNVINKLQNAKTIKTFTGKVRLEKKLRNGIRKHLNAKRLPNAINKAQKVKQPKNADDKLKRLNEKPEKTTARIEHAFCNIKKSIATNTPIEIRPARRLVTKSVQVSCNVHLLFCAYTVANKPKNIITISDMHRSIGWMRYLFVAIVIV